jgi:hypothetical protein
MIRAGCPNMILPFLVAVLVFQTRSAPGRLTGRVRLPNPGQPLDQLRAVVTHDVMDAAAVIRPALGGPQAEPERVRLEVPARILSLEPVATRST